MKIHQTIKIVLYIAAVLLAVYLQAGHINMPGHGNRENMNLEETVVRHVSSSLPHGERAVFGCRYLCDDYRQNGEARFSATVVYYVISGNGERAEHTARIVCNEDRSRIIEWQEIK